VDYVGHNKISFQNARSLQHKMTYSFQMHLTFNTKKRFSEMLHYTLHHLSQYCYCALTIAMNSQKRETKDAYKEKTENASEEGDTQILH
jgi:hypothetical protein